MPDFRQQVALVTGGAAGIGEATARAFAQAGAAVMIADIDPAIARTAEALAASGYIIAYHQVDVSSASGCADMVAACLARFGRLDAAVNNVGVVDPQSTASDILTTDDWDRTISLSLSSVFYCIRAQLGPMLAAGRGTIVNTASIAGLVSLSGRFAYVTAKHGIIGLTKAICDTYADAGIRCNAVAPGLIETPGMRRSGDDGNAASVARFLERVPSGRPGTADEIAQAILWLSSAEANYVNGTTLAIDGGYVVR